MAVAAVLASRAHSMDGESSCVGNSGARGLSGLLGQQSRAAMSGAHSAISELHALASSQSAAGSSSTMVVGSA